jgi:hypothetical protein
LAAGSAFIGRRIRIHSEPDPDVHRVKVNEDPNLLTVFSNPDPDQDPDPHSLAAGSGFVRIRIRIEVNHIQTDPKLASHSNKQFFGEKETITFEKWIKVTVKRNSDTRFRNYNELVLCLPLHASNLVIFLPSRIFMNNS